MKLEREKEKDQTVQDSRKENLWLWCFSFGWLESGNSVVCSIYIYILEREAANLPDLFFMFVFVGKNWPP